MSARTEDTPLETAELTYGRIDAAMLQGWYEEDSDDVDTAVIPRLQVSQTVLVPVALPTAVSPLPASSLPDSSVTASPLPVAPATTADGKASQPALAAASTAVTTPSPVPSTTPRTRHRHASPQSLAAVRRNLVALAAVVVGTVLIGTLVGFVAGWVGVAGYALVVGGLLLAQRRVNARYAPRHSRYVARHA